MSYSIYLNKEWLMENATVDEILGAQEGNLKQIVSLVSKALRNEDQQAVPVEEARAFIGRLKMNELLAFARSFNQEMENAAVPPVSGPDSTPD